MVREGRQNAQNAPLLQTEPQTEAVPAETPSVASGLDVSPASAALAHDGATGSDTRRAPCLNTANISRQASARGLDKTVPVSYTHLPAHETDS